MKIINTVVAMYGCSYLLYIYNFVFETQEKCVKSVAPDNPLLCRSILMTALEVASTVTP